MPKNSIFFSLEVKGVIPVVEQKMTHKKDYQY